MKLFVVSVMYSWWTDTIVVAAKNDEDAKTYALVESKTYSFYLHCQERGALDGEEIRVEVEPLNRSVYGKEGVLHQENFCV